MIVNMVQEVFDGELGKIGDENRILIIILYKNYIKPNNSGAFSYLFLILNISTLDELLKATTKPSTLEEKEYKL